MQKVIFISLLLLFLCVSSIGLAFDNQRRGFIIGGLGGVALNIWNETSYIDTYIDIKSDIEYGFTLHTDFRIGGGFKNNKIMLYFWSVINWFSMEKLYGEKGINISGIYGIGMSYYFKPSSPSF
jgi:hypothetical protein